jgi:hypothetical protein
MPQTVVDLGNAKKQQRPGAYDDMDPATLGRAIKAKFPGQYDDFADVTANPPPITSSPGIWDTFKKTVTTNSPLNPMNWPGMVSSAFESPFSDQSMAVAQHQVDVMNGKVKPEPFTRGDIGEGLGDAVNLGAMYGLGEGIGALPGTKAGAVAGSIPSAIGSGIKAGGRDVAIGSGKLVGGAALDYVLPHEMKLPAAVALGRPVYEGVKQLGEGIAKGAKATSGEVKKAIRDYDFHQDFLNRQTPDYSGYSASTARPDVNQYSAPPPTSPMSANLTSLPESTSPRAFAGESPDQFAARLQAERYPGLSLPSVKTSSTPSGSFGVGLPPGFNPVTPSPTPINPISLPEGVNPARPVTVPSPEDLTKVTLPDWLTPKTPVKAGKQPVTPSAAPPFNLIRQTDARDALEGVGGGVGPGIPVYRVPLSKVVGHEDISGDASKAADISRYADMLKSGSEAPASFGHYDPKTGNVNLTSGSRRLAAAKQAGATDFHVAIPDGAPATGKGIVPITPYKAAAAPGSPVTIQAIPINSPAGIPESTGKLADLEHGTGSVVNRDALNKVNNLDQYLAEKKPHLTADDIQKMSDKGGDELDQLLEDARAYGKAKGNPVPKKYAGLIDNPRLQPGEKGSLTMLKDKIAARQKSGNIRPVQK